MSANDIKTTALGNDGKAAGPIIAKDEKAWRKESRANEAKLKKQLKGDHKRNWDYGYILEYLRLKLRCMRTHFTRPSLSICDNSFVMQIDEALAAIDRYREDAYGDAAFAFESRHAKVTYFDPDGKSTETVTLSYEEQASCELDPDTKAIIDKHHLNSFRIDWDSDENEKEWLRMIGDADKAKHDDLRLFFGIMADHIEEWWD